MRGPRAILCTNVVVSVNPPPHKKTIYCGAEVLSIKMISILRESGLCVQGGGAASV